MTRDTMRQLLGAACLPVTVSSFDDAVGWLRTGHAVLWQRGSSTVTVSADHPGAAQDAVMVLARDLLNSWHTDNPDTN